MCKYYYMRTNDKCNVLSSWTFQSSGNSFISSTVETREQQTMSHQSEPDTHMVGISQRAVCHVETRGLSGDSGGAHQYKNTSEKCEGWGLLQWICHTHEHTSWSETRSSLWCFIWCKMGCCWDLRLIYKSLTGWPNKHHGILQWKIKRFNTKNILKCILHQKFSDKTHIHTHFFLKYSEKRSTFSFTPHNLYSWFNMLKFFEKSLI